MPVCLRYSRSLCAQPPNSAATIQCAHNLPLLGRRKLALFAMLFLALLAGHPAGAGEEDSDRAAERVLVIKSQRTLYLLRDGEPYRSYPVSLGSVPRGHKQRAGDERTPEGLYWLADKNPNSPFYRSIRISYPDAQDRARAQKLGVDPGNDIMIHGQPLESPWPVEVSLMFNWTDGCIAVSNAAMDDIWTQVSAGTLIEIRP